MTKYFLLFFMGLLVLSSISYGQYKLVDAKATPQTQALFYNLKQLAGKAVLFGQQDALMYGIGWSGVPDQSDVKLVSGSHPAVFGWDLESIGADNDPEKQAANAENLKKYCLQVYQMGGVNTLSWHVQNFVTGKNFYDTTRCVTAILPGGVKHKDFLRALDRVAALISSLKTEKGIAVPVIFRPFHEHTGNWFWWGKPFCTAAAYKALWQFTVRYLRDKKKLHQILYAYSPDRISGDFNQYMERYPGDDEVDILGFDNYHEFKDIGDTAAVRIAVKSLGEICTYAKGKNKVAALTETGQEKIVQPKWFTSMFNSIMADSAAAGISYLLVWRNAHTGHFYVPYPRHSAVPDFLDFYNNPKTIFLNDIKDDLYHINLKTN